MQQRLRSDLIQRVRSAEQVRKREERKKKPHVSTGAAQTPPARALSEALCAIHPAIPPWRGRERVENALPTSRAGAAPRAAAPVPPRCSYPARRARSLIRGTPRRKRARTRQLSGTDAPPRPGGPPCAPSRPG